MKPYLLLLLAIVAGQSYAAGDCKLKYSDGTTDLSEDTYTGECKNGYADGKGVRKWSSRSGERYYSYKGDWKDGTQWGVVHRDSHNDAYSGIYINGTLIKKCSIAECDPYDSLDLDQKTKEDILMSKITTAIKEGHHEDALAYFLSLEKHGSNLPESFYFYQIQTLFRVSNNRESLRRAVGIKAQEYLKKYGSKGKYYAEVVEIMGR